MILCVPQHVVRVNKNLENISSGSHSYQLSVCLYPPFLSTRPSDRNQILHTYSDRYGTHSHLNKLAPRMARKAGSLGTISEIGLRRRMRQKRPRHYSMELPPPSFRFSGSSNHLIHAFLAVASLGNLCPPK